MPFVAAVAGLASMVCWILVLIKIFKQAGIGLGILGIICPLFVLIFGWIKSKEWGIQEIMLIWTILLIVGIVLNVMVTLSRSGGL